MVITTAERRIDFISQEACKALVESLAIS